MTTASTTASTGASTGTSTGTAAPTATAKLADDDPRALFAKAVITGGSVIAAVRPDQFANPTPCDEYDVRQVLDHVLTVLHRVAAIGRGEDAFGDLGVRAVADDGWVTAWADAAHAVQAAWTDDAVLDRIVRLPWAELPGSATLHMYTSEVTVHTWDVAVATDQHPEWDPQVLTASLAAMHAALPANRAELFEEVLAKMPPERRDGGFPFADAVDVPADAPLIDQVVAWNGRNPRR